jgi:uncharacterized protein (UPF0332 family)
VLDTHVLALSQYRLERADAMLLSAKRDFEARDYTSANNRAYYCIFHAMRAVLALDNVDFKKHSAIIARFGQDYLKTDRIDRSFGTLIATASLIRNRSDYEDFYICSIEETKQLILGAARFMNEVKTFLAQ